MVAAPFRHLARLRQAEPDLGLILLLVVALTALAWLVQGNVGLGLQDESFLWYGVVQTAQGQAPLADFRSYDPGRYYWCAAWSLLFGDGILALRGACLAFGAVGLVAGLLAARRAVSRAALPLIGVLLMLWMFPRWKLFEPSLAMMAVYAGVLLAEKPSRARCLAAGVLVGLAGFFGRNLGLYLAVSFLGMILLLFRRASARPLLSFAGGVLIGYAPMGLMLLCVPGYGGTLLESIAFYLQQDQLNLALPVPWPWLIDFQQTSPATAVSQLAVGISFLLMPIVYGAGLIMALAGRASPLLVAATLVGATYAHHAAVRSDTHHLAQSIHPLLLACLALSSGRIQRVLIAVLLLLGLLSMVAVSPAARMLMANQPAQVHQAFDAGGDRLLIESANARFLNAVLEVVERTVPEDEPLWISPHYLALYPILQRRSPVWDVYPSWKASEVLEQRMLDELAPVDWILLRDKAIGGNEEQAFEQLYPRVWEMVQRDFERIPTPTLSKENRLLRRKHL